MPDLNNLVQQFNTLVARGEVNHKAKIISWNPGHDSRVQLANGQIKTVKATTAGQPGADCIVVGDLAIADGQNRVTSSRIVIQRRTVEEAPTLGSDYMIALLLLKSTGEVFYAPGSVDEHGIAIGPQPQGSLVDLYFYTNQSSKPNLIGRFRGNAGDDAIEDDLTDSQWTLSGDRNGFYFSHHDTSTISYTPNYLGMFNVQIGITVTSSVQEFYEDDYLSVEDYNYAIDHGSTLSKDCSPTFYDSDYTRLNSSYNYYQTSEPNPYVAGYFYDHNNEITEIRKGAYHDGISYLNNYLFFGHGGLPSEIANQTLRDSTGTAFSAVLTGGRGRYRTLNVTTYTPIYELQPFYNNIANHADVKKYYKFKGNSLTELGSPSNKDWRYFPKHPLAVSTGPAYYPLDITPRYYRPDTSSQLSIHYSNIYKKVEYLVEPSLLVVGEYDPVTNSKTTINAYTYKTEIVNFPGTPSYSNFSDPIPKKLLSNLATIRSPRFNRSTFPGMYLIGAAFVPPN